MLDPSVNVLIDPALIIMKISVKVNKRKSYTFYEADADKIEEEIFKLKGGKICNNSYPRID